MIDLLKEFWIHILMVIACIAITIFAMNYEEPVFNPSFHDDKPLNLETVHYNRDDVNDIKTNEYQSRPTLSKTRLHKKPKRVYYKSRKPDREKTYYWIDENGVKHFDDRLPEDQERIVKAWENY